MNEKRWDSIGVLRAPGQADWPLHTTRDAGNTRPSIQRAGMAFFSVGCLSLYSPASQSRQSEFPVGRQVGHSFACTPVDTLGLAPSCLSDPLTLLCSHPPRSFCSLNTPSSCMSLWLSVCGLPFPQLFPAGSSLSSESPLEPAVYSLWHPTPSGGKP